MIGAATVWFVFRGPARQIFGESHDFAMLWAGARALAGGVNPYAYEPLLDTAFAGGMPTFTWITPVQFLSLYPPTAYGVLLPLGALPWAVAQAVWAVINLLAMFLAGHTMVRWVQIAAPASNRTRAWATLAVVLAVLLWAPAHSCLRLGNLSVLGAAVMLWACSPAGRQRPRRAAVLLGVLTAVKPQLFGPLALAWMAAVPGAALWLVGTGLVVSGISIAWMSAIAPTWVSDLRENLRLFTIGGTADPTTQNANAFTMIDLPPLLHLFLDSRVWVKAATWTLTLAASAAAFHAWRRRRDRAEELPLLAFFSAAALIALLPVYHRFYDAAVVWVAVVWVTASLSRRPQSGWNQAAGIGLVPFLAAGTAIFYVLVRRHGVLPGWTLDFSVPRALLLHHQTLAILALITLLLRDLYSDHGRTERHSTDNAALR